MVTEAYTVIPKGVLRDVVTSVLPAWDQTRAWVLNRPVVGGATTFAQLILEVQPGGGSTEPEPQPEVESSLFLMEGVVTVTLEGEKHRLTEGGFAFIPAGKSWTLAATGDTPARFHWFRKHYEPLAGHEPQARFGQEQDIDPSPMPDTGRETGTVRPQPTMK